MQTITTSGIKKGDVLLADINTQLKNKNITTDVKVDTNSKVSCHASFDYCDFHSVILVAIFGLGLYGINYYPEHFFYGF